MLLNGNIQVHLHTFTLMQYYTVNITHHTMKHDVSLAAYNHFIAVRHIKAIVSVHWCVSRAHFARGLRQ